VRRRGPIISLENVALPAESQYKQVSQQRRSAQIPFDVSGFSQFD